MDMVKLDNIIARHQAEKGSLISILHDIQREEGCIADDAMSYLSSRLKLPLSEVFRVVSYFEKVFSREPRGKHAVKVCQGTACHLKQGGEVLSEIKEAIEKGGADTGCYLEAVRCLGCCTAAPAVEIDGKLLDKEGAKKAISHMKGET